jgi:hypothetical protein
MTAATASAKRESPKIELAGVETGAKIFVGLRTDAKCTEPPYGSLQNLGLLMKRRGQQF